MERKMRYLDKLAHVDRRVYDIESWLPFSSEERTKLAIYKAFQEIVEALFDMVAMKLVDLRVPPKDDYTNLAELGGRSLLSEEMLSCLREANGLRNRLVHSYNLISDELALKSLELLLPELKEVRRRLETWI